jgi:hypothetical protein
MKSFVNLRWLTWIVIGVIHFGLSNLILPITLALTQQAAGTPEGPSTAVMLLVRGTQLLHFPLVTLALYPREWFPGEWVYVLMAANSLLWASGIYWLIELFRKSR